MKIKVLDHGYVEEIECWGMGDAGWSVEEGTRQDYEVGIIEAARQSTQGSFRGWETDSKLLAFLHNNKHATPFEFAGMVIEVQAPIFVFREWHRHRTQSYNEMSARYAALPDLYYTPTKERVLLTSITNKQAQGTGKEINAWLADRWANGVLPKIYQDCEVAYQEALAEGIPKELARLVMPVSHYSRMRASTNLRNWLSFLTLRQDLKAQWEIRQFANAVAQLVEKNFPHTYKLFTQHANSNPA